MGPHETHVLNELATWVLNVKGLPFDNIHCVGLLKAMWAYDESDESHTDHGEAVVRRVWSEVSEQIAAGHNIGDLSYDFLLGLITNNRWRALESDGFPRVFVITAITYIEKNCTSASPKSFDGVLKQRFLESVLGGITPQVDFAQTTTRDVVVAMFGETWCDLVRDLRGESESWADLLTVLKPDFLPGQLTSNTQHSALSLPDLAFKQ
jgi:hypothetical protein